MSDKTVIGVVVGTTRPNRVGGQVAEAVVKALAPVADAEARLLDIEEFGLPMLDEPLPAATGQYSQAHTKKWKQAVEATDALIFVTPEYNGFPAPATINAIDFLKAEWEGKPVAVVGYGFHAAARSIPMLETLLTNVGANLVGEGIGLTPGAEDRDESGRLKDADAVVATAAAALTQRAAELVENVGSRKEVADLG